MSSPGPTPAQARLSAPASGRPRALRWLWVGAVLAPLALLLLGGALTWASVVGYETENAVRTVGVLEGEIATTLEVQSAVLAAISTYIQPMSWAEIATSARLRDFLRHLSQATSVVMSTTIIDPEGRVAASTENIAAKDREALRARGYDHAFPAGSTALTPYVSAPEVDRPGGRLHVHLARPRLGADGRADGGVLLTGFAPAAIERAFAAVAESPTTSLVLARSDGTVLARYPEPVQADTRPLAEAPMLRLAQALAATNAAAVEGGGLPFGPFRLLVVQRVPHYPLFIGCAVDPQAVRAAWWRQMVPLTAAAAAAMLLLLLLLAELERRLAVERDLLLGRAATAEADRLAAEKQAALEARLQQTEKVAALGHLAAGVAHDFNNVLQTILISAEELAEGKTPAGEARELGALIVRVAGRGEALVRRLLDFARRRERAQGVTDLAQALGEVGALLSRALGARHRLQVLAAPAQGVVIRGDADAFAAVMINLVANARDAMPEGGEITLTVAPPRQEAGAALVAVAVRDRGCGMDQATLARAGETFFTTKPAGKGTGLGLSLARDFAARCGGRLELASTPGEGTVVTLWLAVAAAPEQAGGTLQS